MKKVLILFIMLLGILSLTACVVEDDPVDDSTTPVDDEDPIDEEDPLPHASGELNTLFNDFLTEERTFFVYDNAILNTNITNIYVGVDDSDMEEVFVIRSQYMGRWDSVNYVLLIDTDTDTIIGVEIMFHDENWGSFIEGDAFLNQFVDMDINYYLNNDVELGIDGNASATTTIGGFNRTLEDAINYYLENLK